MDELAQAREKVITAAVRLVAGRQYYCFESPPPGPYDDANREFDDELLDEALAVFVGTVERLAAAPK
jgi:hypothetical protein